MVGYTDNQKRDTYRLYNPDTKRVVVSRYIRWEEYKTTDPS